jgi:hypothetical protein
MSLELPKNKGLYLVLGIVLALVGVALLRNAPLHAVAVDRSGDLVMATGPVSDDVEGVFFLDALTGELKGTVVNPNVQPPVIGITYSRNVVSDLQIDVSKSPKFVMVTGGMALRPGAGNNQFASSVVYVAETTSGRMACYAMPFNRGQFTQMRGGTAEFIPLFVGPFRQAVVR